MTAVELDSLTIKDLEARYGVARSNIYTRINALKEKGYPMQPEKQAGKSIFNADQVTVMDALDSHIKAGNEIASFPTVDGVVPSSSVLQDKPTLSYRTPDTRPRPDQSLALALVVEALAGKLQDSQPADPLGNLRSLEEACALLRRYRKGRGWLLSASQLASLLGLRSLNGKEFSRYGFRFTRVGRNGAESAWRVGKESGVSVSG